MTADLWLRVELLGEKEDHIWLYAGCYLLFIIIISGLGIRLSSCKHWVQLLNKICDF